MAGECQTSCPCQAGSRFSCELHTRHCFPGARLQQEKREKTQCGPGFNYLAEYGKGKVWSCRQVPGLDILEESLLVQSGRFSFFLKICFC